LLILNQQQRSHRQFFHSCGAHDPPMTSRYCSFTQIQIYVFLKFFIGVTTSKFTSAPLCELCGDPWFSPCLRITNPKFPRFLRKFIKFFSASPRLRCATWFSPIFLRVSVPPRWVLL